MSLFADGTVICLTNPEHSLPPLLNLIKDFGKVSGFVVKQTKTELFPINITSLLKDRINQTYSLTWIIKKWRHLGIWIPLQLKDLYMVNYEPLWNKIQQLLNDWSNKFLTWLERLELVKAVIFPQFLFLFHVIPVEIPLKELKKWQSRLTYFAWASRAHRISLQQKRGASGFRY